MAGLFSNASVRVYVYAHPLQSPLKTVRAASVTIPS